MIKNVKDKNVIFDNKNKDLIESNNEKSADNKSKISQ